MLETARELYLEGKQRGQVYGFALACIELAGTFRAPATAAKLWLASGYTINQAIAAGLSGGDVAALRRLVPPEAPEPPLAWSFAPGAPLTTQSLATPQ